MLQNYDPILQSLLASLFTWGLTALGAALVFILPSGSRTVLDSSLGFAAGVMTAASFWSLLAPAIEISETKLGDWAFVPVAVGFALGAAFVFLSDRMIPSCVGAELSLIEAISGDHNNRENEASVAAGSQLHTISFDSATHSNSNRKERVTIDETSLSPKHKKEEEREMNFEKHTKSMASGLRHRIPNSSRMLSLADNQDVAENDSGLTASSTDDSLARQAELNSLIISERPLTNANANATFCTLNSPSASSELMLSWRRILLLIMAVTVHNFPEGLAVGVGFGSIGKTPAATFEKAFNLAIGIGLQNFPEGLAVSLPLAAFGYSPFRAFLYGQLSGMVEPIAALLGSSTVLLMESVLPYALSFAAGAMIYVVFDSIVPEACSHGNGKLASASAIVGFLVMMCLDVGLG